MAAAGQYRFNAYVSTPENNACYALSVDGSVFVSQAVANNGSWDSFPQVSASRFINLIEGTHLIRVSSNGSTNNTWEWNTERFVLLPIQ